MNFEYIALFSQSKFEMRAF